MTAVAEFVRALEWRDVPKDVRSRVDFLLRDFAACSLAGRATPTALLAAEYAAAQHPGDRATALLDGRRLSETGAAWANGVLANALDFDDGHRLTKGHPGANVIPAALAAGEAAGAPPDDLRAAILVGYEVAVRAGIALHASSSGYHASGAWGAVGAAAAAARVLGLDGAATGHALGLAEYHAPIAPVMRSVADPAMTKDACGWGAYVGVSSALLARGGFTALRGGLPDDAAADLRARWHVLDVYVKKFPCCRWSHPAIEGAIRLRSELADADAIERVRVRTFAAAAALADRSPATTEEAQYSLVWPVAVALAHGAFGVAHVLESGLDDAPARDLLPRIEVEVDPAFEAGFPARRRAEVTIELAGGETRSSGITTAPGDPEDPLWPRIVEEKFSRFAAAGADGRMLSLLGLQPAGSVSASS